MELSSLLPELDSITYGLFTLFFGVFVWLAWEVSDSIDDQEEEFWEDIPPDENEDDEIDEPKRDQSGKN